MTAKTMAEVLAEHQLCAAWEDDAGRAIICTCGADLPTEPLRGEIDMTFLASHQAEVLAAAGYGPVREAAAEALRDAADTLAKVGRDIDPWGKPTLGAAPTALEGSENDR